MADPPVRNGVMNAIVDWTRANTVKIEKAYNMRGGWEGWAQVELAIYLQQRFGAIYGNQFIAVTREDAVYGNLQRSDLLLTKRGGAGANDTFMIELKCESILQAANFHGAVAGDCTKINNAIIAQQYRPCRAFVVAFNVTNGNLGNLSLNLPPPPVNNRRALTRYETIPAGAINVEIWQSYRDFP